MKPIAKDSVMKNHETLSCDLASLSDDDARNYTLWHTGLECISADPIWRSNFFCYTLKTGARVADDGGSGANEPLRRMTTSRMNHRRPYKFLTVAADKSFVLSEASSDI